MATNLRRWTIPFVVILTAVFASGVKAQGKAARATCFPRLFRPAKPACVLPSQGPPIPSRNLVNLVDRNLPTSWSVENGKFENIKWSADLRAQTFGMPVVAKGRVFAASTDREETKARE